MTETFNRLLQVEGDIQLPPGDDPYHHETTLGTIIQLHSTGQEQQRLTYSMILFAMRGLVEVLIRQHRYHCVSFDIFETGIGLVGYGKLLKGV